MNTLRLLCRGIWDLGKTVWGVLVCLLALTGALAVSEAFTPPNLPAVHRLSRLSLPSIQSQHGGLSHAELVLMDDEQRWQQMQPALGLLDLVCPEVADWVRERRECGHFVFETGDKGRYACWWVAPRILMVNLIALEQSDCDLAATLAHEYRHSRQPLVRCVQVLAAQLCGRDRTDMVEDEARAFENVVRRAIRGW